MAKGTSKGSAVTSFIKQTEALVDQVGKNATAVLAAGTGSVWTLGDKSNWDGDVTDPSKAKKAFDRSDIKDIMNSVADTAQSGTIADGAAMQFQNDYLCSMERAFLTRHSNTVRSEIFAAGRRKALSDYNLRYFTQEAVSEMIERGK